MRFLLLAIALAGCLCEPVLDVQACLPAHECPDAPPWTTEDARAWPAIDRLLSAMSPGDHGHLPLDADAFAAYWGDGQDVWREHEGTVYRFRPLAC